MYDRGHNISVVERPRPEYDPIGVRFGSFVVNPQLITSLGYTSNVFNDNNNRKGDAFVALEPYVTAASDWSVHQLRLTAAGDLRRFATQTVRNQDAWYVQGQGRVDVTSDTSLRFDAQVDRTFESPFSADVVANLTVPSRYLHNMVSGRAIFGAGQSRLTAEVERNSYTFSPVEFADGIERSQRYRDRVGVATSLTYELGFSPSLSSYVRVELDRNDYDTLAFGQPNRDSVGYRAVIGSNFDLAGVARGTIAVGYSDRSFSASGLYPNARGVSAEARADWFPSELTTVGVLLQRRLIDADLVNAGTSWESRARVTLDHELLYNLIVTIGAEANRREYPASARRTNQYRAEINSRYQITRWLGLSGDVGYGSSRPSGANLGNPFDELRARLSLRIRR